MTKHSHYKRTGYIVLLLLLMYLSYLTGHAVEHWTAEPTNTHRQTVANLKAMIVVMQDRLVEVASVATRQKCMIDKASVHIASCTIALEQCYRQQGEL